MFDQGYYQKTPLLDKYTNFSDECDIFRIKKEHLKLFFTSKNRMTPDNDGECREALNILKECGYAEGLCQLLDTNLESGVNGDQIDIERRQKKYGKHEIKMPTIDSFHTLAARQFEDPTVIMLIWGANFYLLISAFNKNPLSFVESLMIFSGLVFACFISATCDWVKEKQFLELKKEINKQEVTVFRGSYGTTTSIPITKLVVGDIVDLNQGDRVPADCILIEEMNMTVDQSIYVSNETNVEKEQSQLKLENGQWEDNHKENPDPFLLTDSKVMTGQGKAVICAVGKNTLLAKIRGSQPFVRKEQKTHLEEKLTIVSEQIGMYAKIIAVISVLSHAIFYVMYLLIQQQDPFDDKSILQWTEIGIVALVILIVAIPEGLPVCISLAMALSVDKLKEEEILIKNVESIQVAGMCHDLCIGKTGCLTKGRMLVRMYQIADQDHTHDQIDEDQFKNQFTAQLEIQDDLKQLIIDAMICNNDARVEASEQVLDKHTTEYVYEPKGQALEVGIIQFLMDNEIDVQQRFVNRNREQPKLIQLPFDQTLKRKTVVRQIHGSQNNVRVYVKGAPEYLFQKCNKTLNSRVQQCEFQDKDQILDEIIGKKMAGNHSLKVLSYAFKEIALSDFNELMHTYPVESAEFRNELETDLIYLCTVGVDDPVIDDIRQSVQLIRYGRVLGEDDDEEDVSNYGSEQVHVRMITGDHIETAKSVAVKAGILSEAESNTNGGDFVMTGDEFIARIGGYEKEWNEKNGEWDIKLYNEKAFDSLKKKIRVIARCTTEIKFVIVTGIRRKKGLIAVTGDSITDALALQKADVGLAMGSGCDVAKDNSDLVILDNDFVSIYRAIIWGRQIFNNVRKFLQFQMTVNIVICVITVIGGCTIGQIPLNIIQLLWTNLIMDVLAAIALGTEPPNKDQKQASSDRVSRKDKLFTPFMWRQILVQAVYQIIVIFVLMYFGSMMFCEKPFDLVTEPPRSNDRLVINTIMFYTFILMNLFNQFNCRLVDSDAELSKKNLNPFGKSLLYTPTFWLVIVFEFGLTYLMVSAGSSELGSALLGTAELTTVQTIICWVLGAFTLIVNIGLKFLPMDLFYYVAVHVDLEGDDQGEGSTATNFITAKYQNATDQYQRRMSVMIDGPEQFYSEQEMTNINENAAESLDPEDDYDDQ